MVLCGHPRRSAMDADARRRVHGRPAPSPASAPAPTESMIVNAGRLDAIRPHSHETIGRSRGLIALLDRDEWSALAAAERVLPCLTAVPLQRMRSRSATAAVGLADGSAETT